MKRLVGLFVLTLALTACSSAPPRVEGNIGIGYWHDDAHHVSCWTFGSGSGSYTAAISCLPDSTLR